MVPTTEEIINTVRELQAISGRSVTIYMDASLYGFSGASKEVRIHYTLVIVGCGKGIYSNSFDSWEEALEAIEEIKAKHEVQHGTD